MYTAMSPILGRGVTTPEAIDRWFAERGPSAAHMYAPDKTYKPAPAGLGAMIVAACRWWAASGYVVNHDLVAGDIAHEAAFWQSKISRDKRNPSGLGAENDDSTGTAYDKAITFATPWEGILATVAHMLTYAVGAGPWQGNDPRYAAVAEAKWLGIAPTLDGLNGRWAWPGTTYGQSVASAATTLLEFAALHIEGVEEGWMTPTRAEMERLLDERYPLRVRVALVDTNLPNVPNVPASAEGRRWETVHETANTSVGANAEMHRQFVANGGGKEGVSFHHVVDDTEAVTMIDPRMKAWQAGDGANGTGNSTESTEVCVNADGEWGRTVENLARHKARRIVADPNRSPERVAQHNKWSGKNCPARLRANGGAGWQAFTARLEHILRDVGYYGWVETVGTKLVLPGQGSEAPEEYPADAGLEHGFKGTLLAMGAAKYPADPARGIVTITGWVREPEWLGEDGCVYQRCQRVTLQYNPQHANNQPWDIVFLLPETVLPWPAGKPRPVEDEPEAHEE